MKKTSKIGFVSLGSALGTSFMVEGCPGTGECPVGHVLADGDPVVWQSDGGIQGNLNHDWPGFIQGTAAASSDESDRGGGWALCFAGWEADLSSEEALTGSDIG